jgi:hypothetical protein
MNTDTHSRAYSTSFGLRKLAIYLALAFFPVQGIFAQAGVGPSDGDEFVGPFASWANVKSVYGAVGDGLADDTNAFQAALNVLGVSPGSAVLYVPSGTYRITRTLSIATRMYIAIIGEDPTTTTLKWGGATGGIILNINGVVDSRFNRLTFDGNRSASIGVDQSWDGHSTIFDTHNEYSDDIFKDVGIGLRGGHLGVGAADSVVLRCQFFRNTVAGVSVENWNALNWFIRDSYFENNYVGVTNTLGAGNFHVYNSLFQRSVRADMEITNSEYFSVRHNVSIGSGYFFLANPLGSAPNPLTFQGNIVLDPTVQAIKIGNAGPVMLLDNILRSNVSPVITVVEGYTADPVNANVVSIGNTFTTANPYSVAGRVWTMDDRIADPASVHPAIPARAAVPGSKGRPVLEVSAGATATDIQKVIDTAAIQKGGLRPIVHIPAGTYAVDRTLSIPPGSDLQMVGDGGASALSWSAGEGKVLRIAADSRATLHNFRVLGGNTAEGVYIDVKDEVGASIYMDQVNSRSTTAHNLLVEGLKNANVSLNAFYHDFSQTSVKVVGPGSLTSTIPHVGGRVDIFGAGDGVNRMTYELSSGGVLVIEDAWYEGGDPGFVTLTDSGSFTLNGGRIYTADPAHGGTAAEIPPIVLNNFKGPVNILNTKIGRGGISLDGPGTNTQLLAMGVNGPAGTPNYLKNNSTLAQTALLDSSLGMPEGNSRSVPDQTNNIGSLPDFVRQMLGELRAAKPLSFGLLGAAPTDVRLFRVIVEQSPIGIHIKTAATNPRGRGRFRPSNPQSSGPASGVSIIHPLANENVTGSFAITAQVPTASTVAFSVDGISVGEPRTTAPFSIVFDSTTISNGPHTLIATATDASGKTSSSDPAPVFVNNERAVAPGMPFLTNFLPSAMRNNFSGWLGMQFTVGPKPITVTALGRQYVAGNTASHSVRLVRASDGLEVPGGSIVFFLSGTPGAFSYGRLLNPVTLDANTSYYLLSNERTGGDSWYDYTQVNSTDAGNVLSGTYWDGRAWYSIGVSNSSYVPLNFLYSSGAAAISPPTTIAGNSSSGVLTGAPLITHFVPGPARNNFTGWVGMKVTVGPLALTATALGRMYLAGNQSPHNVKMVRASDGVDVPGTQVSVLPTGSTGQFVYAPFSSPVTLQRYTAYYVVSQETSGGDQWYDIGTVDSSTAASVNSPVYWDGKGWFSYGAPNTGYVPLNLLYTNP